MKVNQLKAGVILSYLSEAITVIMGLVYTPIMLRLLGQNEYGLYQLSASVISYLGLLSLGFGSSYIRFYSRYKVKGDAEGIARLNGMFMAVFIVIGIISALAGAVLVVNVGNIFKNSLSEIEITTARILMSLMVFNLAISFPGSVFGSYVTAHEQYIFQRTVNILRSLLNPFLTLPLLLMGYKSVGVVVIQTLLSISAFGANIVFCKRKLGMRFNFRSFDKYLLIQLFVFSFWIFLNQMIDQINWSVDKFILGIYSGTAAVAIYGIGGQLNGLYVNFSTSISGVFAPRVNRMVAESDDNTELTKLFTRIGRIQFIVLVLVLSGLIIFGKYFIELWAGTEYAESYYITILLIVPVTIPLIQNLGVEIQRAKNMHKFRSIIYAIIAVINVLMSIPLAKCFGGVGAAVGTALSLLIGNGIIMNVFYHKKIGLDIVFFWKQILAFIPALLVPSVIGFIIVKYIKFDNLLLYLTCILGYIIIYCLSMWFFGMNRYEKEIVRSAATKIRIKWK